eukprot:TRINITY_DN28521_c0_g1_i1.p1 TRINITY_DN28521_c0_g1~~TRINITY_DN28521_c0_g1_i1.p1  ORF type:complete len:534 (-),score=122.44 TRINITY_DN28521_c0_g1_i1:124-1725(-)
MVGTTAAAAAEPARAGHAEAPFCEEASIQPSIAASIAAWSKKLVNHPPVEEMHNHFMLLITEQLGMHMMAKKVIESGDLVLSERAVVRIPELDGQRREILEHRYGNKAAFLAPGMAVNWSSVDEEQKEAALRLFWAHPLIAKQQNIVMDDNYGACQDLLEWHKPLTGRLDVHDLMKFLHIVDLNIHKDGEDPSHNAYAGIFILGSKFTHSCAPNCGWGFNREGYLQYRAMRKILPGEILTFSYIGSGMNLITSTIERRRRLASLWFCCACTRCTSNDLARQMRCPSCSADRCVPCIKDAEERLPAGSTLANEWRGEGPLRDYIVDAERWVCLACGAQHRAGQMPLRDEERFAHLVPQAMQWHPPIRQQEVDHTDMLRQEAASTVGSRHWTWVLATFAWLQKWLVRLKSDPVVIIDEQRLRQASCELANWFADSCPENYEQRLCCLFLAARLAQNLGGTLKEWGYDPHDPLGDEGVAAKRMTEHGWKISETEDVGGPQEFPPARMQDGRILRNPRMMGGKGGAPRPVYRTPGWR